MTRLIVLSVLVFIACGGGGSNPPPDGSPPPGDGQPGDDLPPPDTASNKPVVLVPSSLGNVRDFAFTADAIYPILNIAGRFKLVRCPLPACDAQPQIIGDVGSNTRGRGVEIVGDHIYWVGSKTQIMEANLDGTDVHERFAFVDGGEIEPRLRGMDGILYFMRRDAQFLARGFGLDTLSELSSPSPLPGTATTSFGAFSAIDARDGLVATWADIQGAAPEPVNVLDIVTGQTIVRGGGVQLSEAGLTLGDSGLFYVQEFSSPTHDELFACTLDAECPSPPSVANTFVAAAADGDRVFFPGRTPDNFGTIVTCDLASAAAGTCTPAVTATPDTQLDLLNVRALRVDASAIYVATDAQGAGSLWRIDR